MNRTRAVRWAARILAALTLLSSGLIGVAPATASAPAPAAPAVAVNVNTPGSQWLASCLSSGRTLSVLFVLDVSGSLVDYDPNKFRYDGLKTALKTLALAKPADGSEVTIEAAVAGFGNTWHSPSNVVPWQKINIDSPDSLIDSMVDRARSKTEYLREGTVFSSIFSPAINELTHRGGAESCKTIVWFTDGDNDPSDRSADMCRVGGVIDEMRQAGIVLVGLRLGPTNDPLMATMAVGTSSGQACGTNPIPEGWAPGIYLRADDVKRLFSSVQNIVEGCTLTNSPLIDPGIRRVRVNIYKGVNSVKFDLPGGRSFTAGTSGQSGPFDGINVTSVKEDFYVSMELSLPPGMKSGEWLVSSTTPLGVDDVEYCVFSDLHLAIDEASMSNLEAGSPRVLTINVLDADNKPADLSDFTTVATAASLTGPDGLPRTVEASMNPNGHDIDLLVRTEASDARLDLAVTLTLTTESGLALTPLKLESAVVTVLNEYYPRVTPLDELDLGEALREDPTSAEIRMVGSEKGPTSVCFDAPANVSVPPDAAGADPVYATGCVKLAVGEERTITVSVSTTTAVEGDGLAQIPIQIHAAPDASGFEGQAVLNLPVKWRFSNPLNVGVLIWALIGVIALSVLIPLIAILWANRVTARYDVTNLRVARIPLLIDANGIRRVNPIEGSDAIVGGFSRNKPRGAKRSVLLWGRELVRDFTIDGVTFKRRASWNPFRPARFWAETAENTVLLSTFGNQSGRDARPNAAPFAPAFTVAAVWTTRSSAIEKTNAVEGTLLVLQTSGGRREAKVDADSVVRGGAWASMLATHRPKLDGTSRPGGAAGPPPPPPIPRPHQKKTPPPRR